MACLPAIAATAYFVAIILFHLYNRDWKRIPGHALFGVFAILLILFICERGSEMMAWILLGAPFILVLIGYFASLLFYAKPSDSIVLPIDPPCASVCPCCMYRQCKCRRPCWRPRLACPRCPDCPKPDCPKPKPDNCIQDSLDE
jgi:hypothetical protein